MLSLKSLPFTTPVTADTTGAAAQVQVAGQVQELLRQVTQAWWQCNTDFPAFGEPRTRTEQKENGRKLDQFVDQLLQDIRRRPASGQDLQTWQAALTARGFAFAENTLGMPTEQLDMVQRHQFMEVQQQFARAARQFDPNISSDDIYQAGRNVMTMNFIQLLFGRPVELTPSVLAYSLLYPYTDNFLDDPATTPSALRAFNTRFWRRLNGEDIHPANAYEEILDRLVGMIEEQYQRSLYPQVYASLLEIHRAQARSLELVRRDASPYELDVIGVSFDKGGTSVLADGYLVAGSLQPDEALFLFSYGAFTQLMDDLEDVEGDRRAGRMTIFSQTAGHWPLDAVTNHVFHFGQRIFADWMDFPGQDAQTLKALVLQQINPVLMDTAYRARKFYCAGYLEALERHMPFPFSSMERQRKKLARHKASLAQLVEVLM